MHIGLDSDFRLRTDILTVNWGQERTNHFRAKLTTFSLQTNFREAILC